MLTGKDYEVKIADFGISQSLSKNYGFLHDAQGSINYCSPELLKGEAYNEKTDVWALGCILYEMLTGFRAFSGSEEQIKHRIIDQPIPKFPNNFAYNPQFITIYEACMVKDIKKRASIKQLLKFPIIIEYANKLKINTGVSQIAE